MNEPPRPRNLGAKRRRCGGWLMEFAGDQETVDLLEGECGFRLVNIATGAACSEFLFEKAGAPPARTDVKKFPARLRAARFAKVVAGPA